MCIPALRLEMPNRIQEGHQGVTKCRERAKRALWWPGLSRQIEDLVNHFRKCTEWRSAKNQQEKTNYSKRSPGQTVGTDICYVKKRRYLIVVDYFSNFIEVNYLASLASSETIRALKSVFARHGIPEVVRSDNGPHYDSAEFAKFVKDCSSLNFRFCFTATYGKKVYFCLPPHYSLSWYNHAWYKKH